MIFVPLFFQDAGSAHVFMEWTPRPWRLRENVRGESFFNRPLICRFHECLVIADVCLETESVGMMNVWSLWYVIFTVLSRSLCVTSQQGEL